MNLNHFQSQQLCFLFSLLLQLIGPVYIKDIFTPDNRFYVQYSLPPTCVHVEDGETQCGGEVADESEDHDGPVGGVDVPLYEEGEEEHDAGVDGGDHVGQLAAHPLGQHHGQGLGGEVEDGADDEVEEEAAGEILPGEGEAVHDEGGGEPVEVHDEEVDSKGGVPHDVQEAAALLGRGAGLGEDDLLGLHTHPVLLAGRGQDLLCLLRPALGNQPPGDTLVDITEC